MTMVNALHSQKVIARGYPRTASRRRLRNERAAELRPRALHAATRIDLASTGSAEPPLTLIPASESDKGGQPRIAPPFAEWWRRMRGLRGRLRPAAVATLAVAVAVIPASLLIAAAWPHEPLTLSGPGDADTLLYRDLVPLSPPPQGATAEEVVPYLSLRSYRVRAGDTISEIAHSFDIDLDTLISFNAIRHLSDLREGMELSIPTASGLAYVVKSGDTLSGIAARHAIRMADLLDWNDLQSSAIAVGQTLFLPGATLSENERNAVLGRLFIKPAQGRVTSPYGYRPDPFTGIRRFHNGIDIAAAIGTPIIASMGGRIGRVGVNGNYGRYVILIHADGYQTLYAHLSRAHVTAGRFVAQGQMIGTMGSTGYSTGSHLHFSIFKAGKHVDPSRYLH